MKFLVVDDSLTMRRIIKNSLQKLGFADVSEASNGLEALEEIGKGGINIVLTDLNMPEMDGLELIRQLRAQASYRFVPVIMLTTESQESKKQEGKKAGASGWIVKPFTPDQLVDTIKKFVK